MKSGLKTTVFYLVLFALAVVIAVTFLGSGNKKDVKYSNIIDYFKQDKVASFSYDSSENTLVLLLTNDQKIQYKLLSFDLFWYDLNSEQFFKTDDGTYMSYFQGQTNLKEYDVEPVESLPWWVSFLPYLIVIVILVVIWWFFLSRASGKSGSSGGGGLGGLGGKMNSFSRARTKLGSDEKVKVLFSDVAGADEEKEELAEVVSFLKDPSKYTALGAKIPRGVLLMGAPGTGKTLLAKAVAGEAGVPFYSISGSDFVEMYVGVGASRVRDLFETAKKTAPCIVFIDEIDAVGRHRGAGWGGGHDEREQTLNQLLVEMDGFGGNDGVIVIAATNRPDILDPALLRPGRFDRQITVNYPDIKGREEILKVHSRKKPLDIDVDLSTIAKTTAGFTGADLANLLNEAALLAARRKKSLIGVEEIEDAIIKVIVGPQKKSRIIKEEEKRATAYHEAGHAIVTKFLQPNDPVHQISIIPSGRALGYTLSLPKEDKYSIYKHEMENEIAVLLGGRVAEQLILDDFSAGASNDIQRASEIARKMVTQYGMSDLLGPIVFGTGHDEVFLGKDFQTSRNYSENVAMQIDEEVHRIINEAYKKAEKILRENIEILHFVAKYLTANEIMDSEQFELCFEEGITAEKLDELRERKKQERKLRNEEKRKQSEKQPQTGSESGTNNPGEADEDDENDQDDTE